MNINHHAARKLFRPFVLLAAFAMGPAAHAATLIGDQVILENHFPTFGMLQFPSDAITVGAGPEIACPADPRNMCSVSHGGNARWDVGANNVRVEYDGGAQFITAPFAGPVFTDLDWDVPQEITGVNLSTNLVGFDLSRVSFGPDWVALNVASLGQTGGQTDFVQVDLVTTPLAPIPIPAALPLFLTALASLGLIARARKQGG